MEERKRKSALKVAHVLFKEQDEWNMKIKMYASENLVELANEWLEGDDEAEIDEITKEMFIDFEIIFFDGDMFWGHCIIVNGNINGELTSAYIAG